MARKPGYTIMPGDWTGLEIAINDLMAHILTTDVPTSAIVSGLSAVSAMASTNSAILSGLSNISVNISEIYESLHTYESALSDTISSVSNAVSVLSNAVLTGDYDADFKALVLEK